MGSMSTTLILILGLSLAIQCSSSIVDGKCSCSGHRKEKVAIFDVYVQDIKVGANATVWEVARSEISSSSAVEFGVVNVLDNLLTAGPDYNSKVLGRAQGTVAFTDMEKLSVTMNINFYLTSGRFKGSTITVLGRQELLTPSREMPILGSAGLFRMARGYVLCDNYLESDIHAILHYKFYVYYLDQPKTSSSLYSIS